MSDITLLVDKESPQACANRIKRVRNLANCSRIEFCQTGLININTLKGWERGRYGGVSKIGAKKLAQRLLDFGVQCTAEWLCYGIGTPPRVLIPFELNANNNQKTLSISTAITCDSTLAELRYFHQLHTRAIDTTIQDDAMAPQYQPGDIVAGIHCDKEVWSKLLNRDCLVVTTQGEQVCRRLKAGRSGNHFHLIATNPDTAVQTPVICDAELYHVAPVVWHRRPMWP